MELKNKLKSFRHKHEMNQTEFAEHLGVGRHLYNQWELNRTQPNLESTWKILKKLNIPIEELFYEDDL